MITFKQFFKESVDKIPALDGEREVYESIICTTRSHHTFTPLRRMEDLHLSRYWDNRHKVFASIYVGEDYHQASRVFLAEVNMLLKSVNRTEDPYDTIRIEEISTNIEKVKDVTGLFKVLRSSYNAGFTSVEELRFGVEVNQDAYEGISHAQGDLKGF